MGKGHDHLPIQNEIHILDNSKSISLWCLCYVYLYAVIHLINVLLYSQRESAHNCKVCFCSQYK